MPTKLAGAYGQVEVYYMSELDAVNMMLANAGESPVATLEETQNVNAVQARQVLYNASRDVQLEGWAFNTEYDVKLEVTKPTPGIIPVPKNAVMVFMSPYYNKPIEYANHNIVQRGNKLYDLKNHTDKFTDDIHVGIVYFLPFDELPERARYYITIKAARRFRQAITGGDDGMGSLSQADEMRARNNMTREDANTVKAGFLTPQRHTWLGHDIQRVFRRRL